MPHSRAARMIDTPSSRGKRSNVSQDPRDRAETCRSDRPRRRTGMPVIRSPYMGSYVVARYPAVKPVHTDLQPGLVGEAHTTVDASNLASAFGSGSIDVFATPALVAL